MGPIAAATLRTSVVFGLRLALQALSLVLVARVLGPHLYAAFAATLGVAFLAGAVSTFGTHLVVLSESSKAEGQSIAALRFAPPVTIGVGLVLLAAYAGWVITWMRDDGISPVAILAIGVAEILAMPLLQLVAAELQGKGKIAGSQMLLLAPLVVRCAAIAIIQLTSPPDSLLAFALAYTAGVAAIVLGTSATLAPWLLRIKAWRIPRWRQLKNCAGFAAVNLAALGPAEADKVLAFRVLEPLSAGIYSAASRVIGAAVGPIVALMIAASPRLFREAPTSTVNGTAIRLERGLMLASVATGVSLAIALIVASPAFDYLFGSKYEGIGEIVAQFAWVVPLMGLRITTGNIVMTRGRPFVRAVTDALGLGVLCLAAILGAPQYGIAGMIAAVCAAETVVLVLNLVVLRSERFAVRSFNE